MTCAHCRETVSHSKVKVEEKGKSAVFLNPAREKFVRTRVDGCVVKQSTSADFVVTQKGVGSVIVELKGTDVAHAALQIEATAKSIDGCASIDEVRPVAGLVVCARYPRFDTQVQAIQKRFAANHRAPLHVVTRNDEFSIARVLSFEGPY